MDSIELWLLIVLCGAATYFWRGLGVVFSGRLRTESPWFDWVGCVAYAMLAGLTVRIILMPSGGLAQTFLTDRLLACAVALVAYFVTRRNLFVGSLVGAAVFTAASSLRSVL